MTIIATKALTSGYKVKLLLDDNKQLIWQITDAGDVALRNVTPVEARALIAIG